MVSGSWPYRHCLWHGFRANILLPVLLSRYSVREYYHTVGPLYVGHTVKMCRSTIQMFHLQAFCTQAPVMVSGPWPYMHGLWHTTFGTASFRHQVEANFHLCCCTIAPQALLLFGAIVCLTHGRSVNSYDPDVPCARMLHTNTNH